MVLRKGELVKVATSSSTGDNIRSQHRLSLKQIFLHSSLIQNSTLSSSVYHSDIVCQCWYLIYSVRFGLGETGIVVYILWWCSTSQGFSGCFTKSSAASANAPSASRYILPLFSVRVHSVSCRVFTVYRSCNSLDIDLILLWMCEMLFFRQCLGWYVDWCIWYCMYHLFKDICTMCLRMSVSCV